MTLSPRDRRALIGLGIGAAVVFAIALFPGGSSRPAAAAPAGNSIPVTERRLERVRRLAGAVFGKKEILAHVTAELAQREKGILVADTAPQAQAQLLEVVRRVARAQNPPIEIGGTDLNREVERLGDDYGAVHATVSFNCRIEDLVNLMADLTRQPEAIGTQELRVNAGDAKQKTINVRLTVAGVVPRRLVPEKKGAF